jgi:hypothetical protein
VTSQAGYMQYILCDTTANVKLIGWLSSHTMKMRAKDSDQATAVPGLLRIQKNLLRLFCIRITDYCVK